VRVNQDVIERKRLFAVLDRRRVQPVAWITTGPPGAGKTTLVASPGVFRLSSSNRPGEHDWRGAT